MGVRPVEEMPSIISPTGFYALMFSDTAATHADADMNTHAEASAPALFPALHPTLKAALDAKGYTSLTPVQDAVLTADAAERDLLVSAQTGSGKTVAYGLALADTLLGADERLGQAGAPLALIVAPTRELAMQVQQELLWLYGPAGARVVSCIGGMDARREAQALERGCHIVVGTPGRLCDHLGRGRLNLSRLRAVVLDEADEMLDLGFRDELEEILDATPAERRTLLFSATIAREIAALAKRYQTNALRIDTVSRNKPHADIDYRVVRVLPHEARHSVVNVLRFYDAPIAMVFCGTREEVRHFQASLMERGFSSVALSGELSQTERSRALHLLREGQARVCVATDVAARGLDLPALDLVIHADLPTNSATLLHRSGRTGRAGRKGVSVLIAPVNRQRKADQLLHTAGIRAEWTPVPTVEEISIRDRERMLESPALSAPISDDEREAARILMEGRDAEALAVAVLRLHRGRLPEPEDVQVVHERPSNSERGDRPQRERGRERDRSDQDRPARAPRRDNDGEARSTRWFKLSVGRNDNADPKWIVPLLCRAGHIRKPDIGAIRIMETETFFEIDSARADTFSSAIEGREADEVAISAASAPPAGVSGGYTPRPSTTERGKGGFDRAMREADHGGDETGRPRRTSKTSPRSGERKAGERKAYDKPYEAKSYDSKAGGKPRTARSGSSAYAGDAPRRGASKDKPSYGKSSSTAPSGRHTAPRGRTAGPGGSSSRKKTSRS
ncbi:ATP-dependent RNA helicase [Granulibacter bethesdensis]|uniref:ATP-dependent RNA helicase n=1 Tax=Granulibacter bethesdensis TaxID=364410 RepID=A0AAN0RCL7_9PROT|nr:ATP-dependent RNA helicase [Granulibacter bethesdensis]